MENVLPLSIYVIICIVAFLIYKCYKHYITEKIRSRISCWLVENSADLLDYIQVKCIGKIIEDRYLITTQAERNIAFEIIKAYQKEMKNKYIRGLYTVNWKYARMSYSEYFMCYFAFYLKDHNDLFFGQNAMYSGLSKHYFNEIHYDEKCTITDYGITYNKLYYMVVLFCEKSAYLNKEHDYCSEGIKKVLDSNEVLFCNYLE